jgi:restriction system protein
MTSTPGVPEYRTYFNPILKALKALGGSASIEELNGRVAADLKLSDAVLAVPHDPEHGGRSEFAYKMAWARTYLKYAGYLTNSERGVWSLTPAGKSADSIDAKKTAKEVIAKRRGMRPRPGEKQKEPEAEEEDAGNGEGTDWKHELLETMQRMKPEAFERLAQRLLRESGFIEVTVTGRSGDRGIDGIGLLKLQGILTFRVIFQCKRWRDPVPASAVREFRGAMSGRTDKGLIITTTYFTPEAIREATRDGVPAIELIDGEELVALLKKLKLGVKTELVERATVDPEWFDAI